MGEVYTCGSGGEVHGGRRTITPSTIVGKYRTDQPRLFTDWTPGVVMVKDPAATSYGPAARAGVTGGVPFYLGQLNGGSNSALGPDAQYVDRAAMWPWLNSGGDWVNTAGTAQATTLPHCSVAANAVTSGAAIYTADIKAGCDAAFARGKWNAYIVRVSGSGARSLGGIHSPTQPLPYISVVYADASTDTLACLACAELTGAGGITHLGSPEVSLTSKAAMEFEMPTQSVTSATLTLPVSSHNATAATIQFFLANPHETTNPEQDGIASSYQYDAGLEAHSECIYNLRILDGMSYADVFLWYSSNPTLSTKQDADSDWSRHIYGLGDAAVPTKLPFAFRGDESFLPAKYSSNPASGLRGKFLQNSLQTTDGTVSIVDSGYAGEGFAPLAPGLGAIRVHIAGQTAADGTAVGYSGDLGSDSWLVIPEADFGNLDRLYVRFYARFGTNMGGALADLKMYRNIVGGSAFYIPVQGKWGITPSHWTAHGGNSGLGGLNKGWSDRLGLQSQPSELGEIAGITPFVHSYDNYPAQRNQSASNQGGLGASLYPGRWYCIEIDLKLNTWNAAGGSPSDGEQNVYIDGVLASRVTGFQFRDGPLDSSILTTTEATSAPSPGTPYTKINIKKGLSPCRRMGHSLVWLNDFQGGVFDTSAVRTVFYTGVVVAKSYIGPMSATSIPSWAPASGECKTVSYAAGTHPAGLGATLAEITTKTQSWNPTPANDGPWAGTDHLFGFNHILDFGGFGYNTDTFQYFSYGGGHSAINVPVPFCFDLTDRRWKWLGTPPPSDGMYAVRAAAQPANKANLDAVYPTQTTQTGAAVQYNTDWGDWNGDWTGWPSGFGRPGKIFPEPGHGYMRYCYIPGADYGLAGGAFLLAANPTGSTTGSDLKTSHLWEFGPAAWKRTSAMRPNGVGASVGATVYDKTRKKAICCNAVSSAFVTQFAIFSAVSKDWTLTNSTNSVFLSSFGGGIVIHEGYDLLLAFSAVNSGGAYVSQGVGYRLFATPLSNAMSGSPFAWQEITLSVTSWPVNAAGSSAGLIDHRTFAYCPDNGCLYALNGYTGSTQIWKLTPPGGASTQSQALAGTWTVAPQTFTGEGLFSRSINQVTPWNSYQYGKLQWAPHCKSFLWMSDDYTGPVQMIRPPGV